MKLQRNKKFNKQKNQKGVVLISVLIFLLLLVYFVRSSMSAAIVNEEKAGADLDLTIARESAYLALQDAIHDIRAEDFASVFCGNDTCGTTNARVIRDNATTNKTLGDQEKLSFAAAFLANKASPTGENGLFNEESQKQCVNGTTILPLWHCVDWGIYFGDTSNNFHNLTFKTSVEYGTFTGAKFPYGNDVPLPRYIIEIFPGKTLGLAKGNIARVTAVGFGRKSSDVTGGGVTNIMQQAVYVLE